jgi:hypothetical protein
MAGEDCVDCGSASSVYQSGCGEPDTVGTTSGGSDPHGQHYDYETSGIFFDTLELPRPDANLGVGLASHGTQTGAMVKGVEDVLPTDGSDYLLIYGDANSTPAPALVASSCRCRLLT